MNVKICEVVKLRSIDILPSSPERVVPKMNERQDLRSCKTAINRHSSISAAKRLVHKNEWCRNECMDVTI